MKDAVIAFEQWLRGEAYQDIEPERRQWIVDQINSGELKGKPLVYYTENIPDNSWGVSKYDYTTAPNHAHILQKLINESKSSLSEKRVVTAADKKRAIELLTNSIDFAKGVIDKIDYSAKYKPMSEESKATRAEMVSRVEEDTKLLEGLKDGSSEVIINWYGAP